MLGKLHTEEAINMSEETTTYTRLKRLVEKLYNEVHTGIVHVYHTIEQDVGYTETDRLQLYEDLSYLLKLRRKVKRLQEGIYSHTHSVYTLEELLDYVNSPNTSARTHRTHIEKNRELIYGILNELGLSEVTGGQLEVKAGTELSPTAYNETNLLLSRQDRSDLHYTFSMTLLLSQLNTEGQLATYTPKQIQRWNKEPSRSENQRPILLKSLKPKRVKLPEITKYSSRVRELSSSLYESKVDLHGHGQNIHPALVYSIEEVVEHNLYRTAKYVRFTSYAVSKKLSTQEGYILSPYNKTGNSKYIFVPIKSGRIVVYLQTGAKSNIYKYVRTTPSMVAISYIMDVTSNVYLYTHNIPTYLNTVTTLNKAKKHREYFEQIYPMLHPSG